MSSLLSFDGDKVCPFSNCNNL